MNVAIKRYSVGEHSTLGALSIDGAFRCFTLEDPERKEKIPGVTAIPRGRYTVTLRTVGGFHQRYSKRFPDLHHGMLWVRGVPDFEYILIHIGNTPEHTRGCILVGDSAEQNVTAAGRVLASERAYRRIYPEIAAALVRGEAVTLSVGAG